MISLEPAVDLFAEQSPLGGLERWLADPEVDEVLVNGGHEVWIDRRGCLERVGSIRAHTVRAVIEHLLMSTGRRVDRSHPSVDARLADGSRLCAVIEPVAVDGPNLAIRRGSTRRVALRAFATPDVAALLEALISQRCNIIVSGATSSGKTTLLGALMAGVAHHERIVTLEDVAELRLDHPHVVRLETREATPDGVGAVSLGELLRTALRLRPDRLVVGEIRGDEAVHLLQAMNTGHDGSLATLHANGAADAIDRLTSLVVQAVPGWPLAAVRTHVGRAVDVVVHIARRVDGARLVDEVIELAVPALDGSVSPAPRVLVTAGARIDELRRGRSGERPA